MQEMRILRYHKFFVMLPLNVVNVEFMNCKMGR
jgi:hypothetical protein